VKRRWGHQVDWNLNGYVPTLDEEEELEWRVVVEEEEEEEEEFSQLNAWLIRRSRLVVFSFLLHWCLNCDKLLFANMLVAVCCS
jgi:hypothetical protein